VNAVITNIQGQQVYDISDAIGRNGSASTIQLGDLKAGIYILKLNIDGQLSTSKLIKN
jgi:hypothetical protein